MAAQGDSEILAELLLRMAQDDAPERLLTEAFAHLDEKLLQQADVVPADNAPGDTVPGDNAKKVRDRLHAAILAALDDKFKNPLEQSDLHDTYQALFEHASDGIIVMQDQGPFIDVNPAACTLTGYSREQFLRMRHDDILEESAQTDFAKLVNTIRIGETVIREHQLRCASGVMLAVETTTTRMPDGQIFSLLRDLSSSHAKAQKNANVASMLQALCRVNHCMNRSSDPRVLIDEFCAALVEDRRWPGAWLLLTDIAGRPKMWAQRGLGSSVQSAVAQYKEHGLLPCMRQVSQQKKAMHFMRSACSASACPVAPAHPDTTSIVSEIVHDGRSFGFFCGHPPVDFRVNDEEVQFLGGMVEDLGFALRAAEIREERHQAIDRLREEMAKAQQYLALAPVVLLALDKQGGIVLVNHAGAEIFDRQEYALLGKPLLEFIDDSQRILLQQHLENLPHLQEGEVEEFELTVILPHAVKRQVSWRMSPRRDELGELMGSFWAGLDMTHTRQAEQQLAQSDRLATIGQLAAGVAHEINNPLTYVLYNLEEVTNRLPELIATVQQFSAADNNAEHLGKTLPTSLSPDELADLSDCVRDARIGTERVRDIVRDLKVFSRDDELETTAVDLALAVDTAISLAFNEIKYRAKLSKDLAPTPMVEANEGRISQIVLNLLINAAQAIHEGQVNDNLIEVKTWAEDGMACLSVRDTGSGIAAKDIDKVFVPFFTTKPKGIGTGLGLSICRSIVESYNGQIEVQSELGQGSTFEIRFPRMRITLNDVDDEDDETSEPKQAGARILVVDDDPLLRALVVRTLAKQHDVLAAESGSEALAIIEQDKAFDLILCDIMMPEVTGIDLYYRLEKSDPDLAQRILFMTGGVFTANAKEFLLERPQGFIEKPFEIKVMRKFIDDFLRRSLEE